MKTDTADVLGMSQPASALHKNVHRSSARCHARALSWSIKTGTRTQQAHARWKRPTEAGKAAAETHRSFSTCLVAPTPTLVTLAPHDSPALQLCTPLPRQQRDSAVTGAYSRARARARKPRGCRSRRSCGRAPGSSDRARGRARGRARRPARACHPGRVPARALACRPACRPATTCRADQWVLDTVNDVHI